MNLIMASVLLLAMLAFQPTLIYGTKNLASARTSSSNSNSNRNIRSSKYGKRHSAAEPSLYSPALSSSSAKLVMSMESGDVLVRAARGTLADNNQNATPAAGNNGGGVGGNSGVAAGSGSGKRQKNNKKLNKNLSTHESPSAASSSSASSLPSSNGRKRLEKKLSITQHQQQQQQQNKPNNKQRQMLKSQNHEGKRSGGKKENVEKLQSESEKTSTTCRYAKSAWTECDPKTNMRSRTLTLKKGEPNCLETRTMQKKCKKSCRYEKGAWSECTNGQMTREDKLKATGVTESSCEPLRNINKKCNPNNDGNSKQGSGGGAKKERKNKEKGSRRVIKN